MFKNTTLLLTLCSVPALVAQQTPPQHGIQYKTMGGWSDGSGGGASAGCSGHAKGYPPGWVFKAVFEYNTNVNSICIAYLYQPDGTLDECLGEGDCGMLCSNNQD
jgi:hypothetical protein